MSCKLCAVGVGQDRPPMFVPRDKGERLLWDAVGQLAVKHGLCKICYMACLPICPAPPIKLFEFPDGHWLGYHHWHSQVVDIRILTSVPGDDRPIKTLSFYIGS